MACGYWYSSATDCSQRVSVTGSGSEMSAWTCTDLTMFDC